MERAFIGKSTNGAEVVVYILEEAKEVLKILNKVQEVAPGYSFCGNPDNYMRFSVLNGVCYLVSGVSESGSTGKSDLPTFYADEVEEYLKSNLQDYSYLETREGLYEINLNGMGSDELQSVLSRFMSADADFNLVMPEGSVHMAWMPVLEDRMYCLKPVICPSFRKIGEWDTKVIEGYEVALY